MVTGQVFLAIEIDISHITGNFHGSKGTIFQINIAHICIQCGSLQSAVLQINI